MGGQASRYARSSLTTATVILPKKSQGQPWGYGRHTHKGRKQVERCVNALKRCRRVATRYEKTARNFPGVVLPAAITLRLE